MQRVIQKDMTFRKCSATWKTYEEKMTDVNIVLSNFSATLKIDV